MDSLSFSLSVVCTHIITHTALTSCFYPRQVIQGSGVPMETKQRPDILLFFSSLALFQALFCCSSDQAFLSICTTCPPFQTLFLPDFTLTPFPQPPSILDFTQLPLNINSFSLRSFTVNRIVLIVREAIPYSFESAFRGQAFSIHSNLS